MQATTLEKLRILETIYQKGYQHDVADRALDKLIRLEFEIAQRDLKNFQNQLQMFEKQYQMTSENFYYRFHKGELGDEADLFEWSAVYDMYQSVSERVANLPFGSV